MSHRISGAPLLVALAILMTPVLYLGGYFLLVIPGGRFVADPTGPAYGQVGGERPVYGSDGAEIFRYEDVTYIEWRGRPEYYRACETWCARLFAPLEQLDRAIRPRKWQGYPTPPMSELEQRWRRGERVYR